MVEVFTSVPIMTPSTACAMVTARTGTAEGARLQSAATVATNRAANNAAEGT